MAVRRLDLYLTYVSRDSGVKDENSSFLARRAHPAVTSAIVCVRLPYYYG
jgi:hypothetical protein